MATAASLARYAVAHYHVGRCVGNRMNCKDVTSAYCRYKCGVHVDSLDCWSSSGKSWQDVLIENRRVTPADLADSRIDCPA